MGPGRTIKVKAFPELNYSIYFLTNRRRMGHIVSLLEKVLPGY